MSALPCPEGGGAQHNKLCKLASGQMPQHSKAMPGCNRRLLPQPVQVQGCDRRSLPACTTCCAEQLVDECLPCPAPPCPAQRAGRGRAGQGSAAQHNKLCKLAIACTSA